MSGKADVAKGRIKEAAGVLTGNNKLRAQGKADQAISKVKLGAQEGRCQGQAGGEETAQLKFLSVQMRLASRCEDLEEAGLV